MVLYIFRLATRQIPCASILHIRSPMTLGSPQPQTCCRVQFVDPRHNNAACTCRPGKGIFTLSKNGRKVRSSFTTKYCSGASNSRSSISFSSLHLAHQHGRICLLHGLQFASVEQQLRVVAVFCSPAAVCRVWTKITAHSRNQM